MDKRNQIQNSLIYMLPKIATTFFSICALAVYTRFLTKYDFGAFALAEVCAIFLTGIVNFGMIVGFERNFFKYQDEAKRRELLYSTLSFVLAMFIIFVGLTYAWRDSLSKWIVQSDRYGNLIFVLFCATVFISLNQYFFIYFRNEEKPKRFVLYTVIFSSLNVFFPVILIVFAHKGIMGLAWGQLLASLAVFVILGIRFLKEAPFSLNFSVIKDVFKISYPLTPRIFFGVINSQINKYILAIMSSVGGVGLFSIAQRIANAVFVFMTTLQNVFNPGVYKKMFSKENNSGVEIGKYLTPFLYFSVAFALVLSLFSEEVLYIVTAKEFRGAANMVTVLSVYYAILFFGKITGLQLIFVKKTFITSILTIFTIGLNVLIAIPLTKQFGAIGAAWATLLVGIISGMAAFVIAQRFFAIKWEYRKVVILFSVLIFSSGLLLIMSEGRAPYISCLVLKCLSFAAYFYIGIRMKILTKENLIIFKNIITLKKEDAKVIPVCAECEI